MAFASRTPVAALHKAATRSAHAYSLVAGTPSGRAVHADSVVAALKCGEQSLMARVVDIGDSDNPREPPR